MNAAERQMSESVPIHSESVHAETHENRKLEYVDPNRLAATWGLVRPLLEKYTGGGDWAPEDAYSEIKAGRSHLFLGRGGEDGFVIVSTTADWRGSIFWIWFAYGERLGKFYWPTLVEMAKEAGCTRIAFSSQLRFWKTYCAKYGFHAARTVYELELEV